MSTIETISTTAQDQDLEQRILASLGDLHVPSLRGVTVQARGGQVVLRGQVTSFYAKQISQHSARRVAGEDRVVDEVRVVTPATLRSTPRASLAAAGALLLAVALAGCSKGGPEELPVHPVNGQVVFNGKPAAGASIIFHPKAGGEGAVVARAQADNQGNYTLSTYRDGDGAPAGEYAVTVELRQLIKKDGEFESGPNIIPRQYSSPATTRLVFKVAEGANSVPIKITR